MPFNVPGKLIAERVAKPDPKIATPALRHETKTALCMHWLHLKLSQSKQEAGERVKAVFDELASAKSQGVATLTDYEFQTVSSLGRKYQIYVESAQPIRPRGWAILGEAMQQKHAAAVCLFTSSKGRIYPIAAYRSGGKGGLNPHIYLFLPGIGELKGIKPKEFRQSVELPIRLSDRDRLDMCQIFPVRLFNAGELAEASENDSGSVASDSDIAAGTTASSEMVVEADENIYCDPWTSFPGILRGPSYEV